MSSKQYRASERFVMGERITTNNSREVGTTPLGGLKSESVPEKLPRGSFMKEAEVCNVNQEIGDFNFQDNSVSEFEITKSSSKEAVTILRKVFKSESALEATSCTVNGEMAIFGLQENVRSGTGINTNNGQKVCAIQAEVVTSESVPEAPLSKSLKDEIEATSCNVNGTIAVIDLQINAKSETGITTNNGEKIGTILAEVVKSESVLEVLWSGSLINEIKPTSCNLNGTMEVFDPPCDAKSETGISTSNIEVVKSESALEVASGSLKDKIGTSSSKFEEVNGTMAVFDLQASAKCTIGIIGNDQKDAIISPGVIKSESVRKVSLNWSSLDEVENTSCSVDDETIASGFQGKGMSKFEKIDLSANLDVKIKKENEDESRITRELVGHFCCSKAGEDQKATQVVKRELCCGSIKKENNYDVHGNCFNNSLLASAINERIISETDEKAYSGTQTLSEIQNDSSRIKLLNVSVKLEDLFPSHSRKLGEAHSNKGSCLCIYCRGEFRCTTNSRHHLLRKSRKQLSENFSGEYRNKMNYQQGAGIKIEGLNNESLFRCEECSKKFKNRYTLSVHLRVHSSENTFPCTLCPLKFTRISSLDYHYKVHYDDKPFLCKQCPAKFTHLSRLQLHLQVHSNDQPFTCDQCSAKFKQKCSLKVHSRVHKDQRPFQCPKCAASFKFSCNLTVHSRVHSGEKPFKCKLCSREFMTNTNLKNHVRVHSSEKPYKCKLCPARFAQSSSLGCHVKNIHSDVRPFECKLCAKRFKWRTNLTTHLRVHSGEKPFKCKLCPLGFAQGSTLTNHIKNIHTDVRVFKCKHCPKKFMRSSRLESHLEIHRGGELLSCAHCSASFKLKLNLIRHLKQFH